MRFCLPCSRRWISANLTKPCPELSNFAYERQCGTLRVDNPYAEVVLIFLGTVFVMMFLGAIFAWLATYSC